jgi:beta-N-acetylhexosaminidase
MKYLFRNFFVLLFIIYAGRDATAQEMPAFLKYLNNAWVDSTLANLTIEQKIGQLFIVQAYSREGTTSTDLLKQIKTLQVGGVIFMQGTAANQIRITSQLQQQSKVPLLIAIDAEWGPAFRLKDTPGYPIPMALGAILHDSLIYQMGYEIGLQLKRLGAHVNFAPVADVNNNPNNPVINYRSFGENPEKVAQKSWLYAKGMQDAGVLAVAKHFPGHGDTRTDSHHDLPVIRKDPATLQRTELYPFEQLVRNGIGGIMTAHLQVPALDPTPALPSSLSRQIVKNILIEKFGFDGLIVTDAMNMQGVSNQFAPGEAVIRALQAGNDMIEIVPNLSEAIRAVREAIKQGRLTEEEIDWKCRKILALKKWTNAIENDKITTDGLEDDLNNPQFGLTQRLLHEQSLTLLRNHNQLLPLQMLDTLKVAVIAIGSTAETTFQKMAARYINADFFYLKENATPQEVDNLVKSLNPYNLLICGIHKLNLTPAKNYGTDASMSEFIHKTTNRKRIMVLFGNPYALNYLPGIDLSDVLLVTYQENTQTQELAAQAVFGAIHVNGRLPVNVSTIFRMNDGIEIKKNSRLKYTLPEEVGISSAYLKHQIDSLAELGLAQKAYPGCQVLIAKDGCVIFQKCYGYHTYEKVIPVKEEDLYDLASLTKIIGPVPALMKLYGEGKFKLDIPFSTYWPAFKGTDKERITPRQMLAHQSRLKSGISFWSETLLDNRQLDPLTFQDRPSTQFDIRVSSHLYMNRDHIQKMYDLIRDSKLLPQAKYVYSDLPFYLFPKVIENLTGENYEEYLQKTFFRPLGASTITYNPYNHFPISQIAPTENDDFFRNELIQGFVHDEGAAMMGGVSGNAGLFATTNDLAKVMQLYLQNGYYGGQRLIDPASLAEFTKVQYPERQNRRGLGFDKPFINNYLYRLQNAYPAPDASPESYGHSGFTGTFTWVDPKKQILFIFMTNRIYPTRNNPLLSRLNIRSAMLQAIYNSIRKGLPKH